MDYLCASKTRNKYITNLTNGLQGNTLLLFQYVEKHGRVLQELIEKKVEDNRKVFFVFGGVSTQMIENKLGRLLKNRIMQLLSQVMEHFQQVLIYETYIILFFLVLVRVSIRNLQSIGRGLRLGDNKTNATLYDIADDVSYNEKENYTLQHFKERINIYNEESFDYEIHNVELKE